MKKKWRCVKYNILYYLSIVDVAVTGFVFHLFYRITRRKRPEMMSPEMLEELRKIMEEEKKKKVSENSL